MKSAHRAPGAVERHVEHAGEAEHAARREVVPAGEVAQRVGDDAVAVALDPAHDVRARADDEVGARVDDRVGERASVAAVLAERQLFLEVSEAAKRRLAEAETKAVADSEPSSPANTSRKQPNSPPKLHRPSSRLASAETAL